MAYEQMTRDSHANDRVNAENREPNRFSRDAFGGGEAGEMAAQTALCAHEALLEAGVRVVIYRGNGMGEGGVIEAGEAGGRSVYVRSDGLRWTVETRNLEIV